MAASADDDVVMHGYPDDRAGHLDIRLRRRRITRGMIVHEQTTRAIALASLRFLFCSE